MLPLPPYILYTLAVVVSALISIYTVKKTIFVTTKMKIYDVPDKIRKIHGDGIPSLGGIGIFTGYLIVAVFFWPRHHFFMPAVMSSSVLLFFTGIYDDLANMSPPKKLVAQLLASFITLYFADIRIEPVFEAFGTGNLPLWADLSIAVLCCTFFINVFNFIDGIDGLACTLAIIYLGAIGLAFALTSHPSAAGISFALMGGTAGLLYFNIAPAKIYMGDTGSMFLGFTIFNFALLLLNWCFSSESNPAALHIHGLHQVVLMIAALLFLPVYDGIRVFALRISKGVSPLKADRSHLHYYLLDAGLTHTQAVMVITGTNLLVLAVTFLLQDRQPFVVLTIMTAFTSSVVLATYFLRKKKLQGKNQPV